MRNLNQKAPFSAQAYQWSQPGGLRTQLGLPLGSLVWALSISRRVVKRGELVLKPHGQSENQNSIFIFHNHMVLPLVSACTGSSEVLSSAGNSFTDSVIGEDTISF